jgi:glycine hydroxymethyltransferase
MADRAHEGDTGTVPATTAVRDTHFEAPLGQCDPAVADLLAAEARRQAGRLELGASENYVSRAQLQASGSAVCNVTVEGYPGARFLGTSPHVDALERLAIKRACRVFDAAHANVQPHSGTQANQAVFMALLRPGDTLLSMRHTDGGHFSHGDPATLSGQWYRPVHYGVRAHNGLIDYDEVQALADAHRPRLIVAGGSAYPRSIDFERLAQTAASVGARLMVDIAHVAGLVAAGLFPNPFPHADVVTTTTYKNLRGVRGGLILTRDRALGVRIDEALCPGVQGTPVLGLVAGKAVALGEALTPAFVAYHRQVLTNARALVTGMTRFGLPVLTGGTDTPFVVLDLRPLGLNGRQAATYLDACGIGTNSVPVPGDADFARARGLRLGTSAITTRGMDESDCAEVAELVALALRAACGQGSNTPAQIERRVRALVERFPLYGHDATGGVPDAFLESSNCQTRV